jgi:hypothetical protein
MIWQGMRTNEVSCGGGVRNSLGTQSIQVSFVLTPVFPIFQAPAIAQGIECDVEHVIRLVVGQVGSQQYQATIDGVNQARFTCQLVHQTDTAVRRGQRAFSQLVVEVRGAHYRAIPFGVVVPVQAL